MYIAPMVIIFSLIQWISPTYLVLEPYIEINLFHYKLEFHNLYTPTIRIDTSPPPYTKEVISHANLVEKHLVLSNRKYRSYV